MAKGDKRKRKGGRPRLPGQREPNGRLSRKADHVAARDAMTEQEAKSVMVQARARMTGLPEDICAINHAGRPHAGNVHGVMCLRGELTLEEWQAAEWFIGKRAAWLRSIGAAEAIPTGTNIALAYDEDAYAKWCASIRSTWNAVVSLIQDVSTSTRSPVMAAMDVILIRNEPMDHLVGDLRLGLNAIHRHFMAEPRKVA